MITIDYAIVFLIVFFALLSFSRGIIAEVVFILKWVFSIVGARVMYGPFSELIFGSIEPLWLKQTLGFGLFFLIFYIVLNYFGRGLTRIVRFFGLGGVNHFLGIIFGTLKGVIVVMALVFVCSYTNVIKTEIWQDSVLLPFFNELIVTISPFVQDMLESKSNISDINQILFQTS
ncbi:MAG: CvpA family protein [Neisseriaceae bacterium]|nr:CvpA family protein [Neisseriaceae bacterium]